MKRKFEGRVLVTKYKPGDPAPAAPPGGKVYLIHTAANGMGVLSPYQLRDPATGALLENIWQFAKVYSTVPAIRTPVHRFQPNNIAWEHPAETHIGDDGQPTAAYWEWRKKGLANRYAVRYPAGFAARRACLYSLWPAAPTDEIACV